MLWLSRIQREEHVQILLGWWQGRGRGGGRGWRSKDVGGWTPETVEGFHRKRHFCLWSRRKKGADDVITVRCVDRGAGIWGTSCLTVSNMSLKEEACPEPAEREQANGQRLSSLCDFHPQHLYSVIPGRVKAGREVDQSNIQVLPGECKSWIGIFSKYKGRKAEASQAAEGSFVKS